MIYKILGGLGLLVALFFGVRHYNESLREDGREEMRAKYATEVLTKVQQGVKDAEDVARQNEVVGNKLVADARGTARRLRDQLSAINSTSDSVQAGASCDSTRSAPSGFDPEGIRTEVAELTSQVIASLHAKAVGCGIKVQNIEEKIQ